MIKINEFTNKSTKENEILYLMRDNWNDYNYMSTFKIFHKKNGKDYYIDNLNLAPITYNSPQDKEFISEEHINEFNQKKYISLGGDKYYKFLNKLPDSTRENILNQLGDLAYDLNLFEKYRGLGVVQTSFLRGRSVKEVKGELHRLAVGEIKFTYDIDFLKENSGDKIININMNNMSLLPTNIHAFIGNNGAGKTKFLQNIALACDGEFEYERDNFGGEDIFITSDNKSNSEYLAEFRISSDNDEDISEKSPIANVIYFSYSPFDDYSCFKETNIKKIGLEQIESNNSINEYMLDMLDNTLNHETDPKDGGFKDRAIRGSISKVNLWNNMIENLNFDKNFSRVSKNLIFEMNNNNSEFRKIDRTTIKSLSSGQKILLLSLAKLINEATERSIIIIDEPELFLHPPLITSYVREISNVLKTTNSLCLIATHSPFIVQEIPKECVHIVRSIHGSIEIEEPITRTFGENIDVISQSIFGRDLRLTGYYKLLEEISNNEIDKAERLIESNILSYEAEVILKAMLRAERDK